MAETYSSETSVDFQRTMRYYIQEDRSLLEDMQPLLYFSIFVNFYTLQPYKSLDCERKTSSLNDVLDSMADNVSEHDTITNVLCITPTIYSI
jgi:hypothetical protein